MPANRPERVAALLQQELSQLLLLKAKDKSLKDVIITRVTISRDLKYAKAYYSVIGGEEKKANVKDALNRANSYIRTQVGKTLGLRIVPEIRFIFDDSGEYAAHIQDLINKTKEQS